MLFAVAPPEYEMRILPSNCSAMRFASVSDSGYSARPDMYISSLGSSPRVTSTGKVFVSLTPNSTPRSALSLCRRSIMGTASAHCRSSSKWCESNAM